MPGIVGKSVRYAQQVQGRDTGFALIVTTLGVSFDGSSDPIRKVDDLDNFALVVSKAWKDYLRMGAPIEKEISNDN